MSYSGCSGCRLGFAPQISPTGPENSPVVIVGECPGSSEVKRGIPFVGPSGKLLREVLTGAGISFGKCRIQNSFMCKKDTSGSASELLEYALPCRERLKEDIEKFPRRLIIAFGKCACSTVGNVNINDPISSYHGKIENSRFHNPDGTPIPVLYTVHPAAVLRSGGTNSPWRDMLIADIGRAVRYLKDETSDSESSGDPEGEQKYKGEGYFELLPDSRASLLRVFSDAKKFGSLAVDIETTCLCPEDPEARILGISLCANKSRSVFITRDCEEAVKKIMELRSTNPEVDIIGHNCKFDAVWLGKFYGVNPSSIFTYDTMLAAHLIDERSKIGLKFLVETIGIHDLYDEEAIVSRNSGNLDDLDPALLAKYAAADAWATRELYLAQQSRLVGEKLDKTLRRVVMTHSNLLSDVESRPVYIDRDLIQTLSLGVSEQLSRLSSELDSVTGVSDFNPNSVVQVRKFLFEDLGILPLKKTEKGNPSADNEVLLMLSAEHEAIPMIIRYRSLKKIESSYVKNLLGHAREDGNGMWYVLPNYNLAATVTGRTSCRDPNIQQIPKAIRGIFIPPPGHVFVCADMCQAEARVMGMYCKDPALLEIFGTRECPICRRAYSSSVDFCEHCPSVKLVPSDPYTNMARRMYGHDEISKEERNSAKIAYLAGIYQESAASLAAREGVSERVAESWLASLARTYPEQANWIRRVKRQASSPPYEVMSLYGRRRRLKEFFIPASYQTSDERSRMVAQGIRQAVNFPIQSASSDMCLLAMSRIHSRLIAEGIGYASMFIHDEIDVVVKDNPESIRLAEEILYEEMRKSPVPAVNLEVEITVRDRWGDPSDIQLWLEGKIDQRGNRVSAEGENTEWIESGEDG